MPLMAYIVKKYGYLFQIHALKKVKCLGCNASFSKKSVMLQIVAVHCLKSVHNWKYCDDMVRFSGHTAENYFHLILQTRVD